MTTLTGRVAIVTGGGASLGEAISNGLARRGAFVVIADRDAAGAQRVQKTIETSGGTALAVEVDVLDETALRHMLGQKRIYLPLAGPAMIPCWAKPPPATTS